MADWNSFNVRPVSKSPTVASREVKTVREQYGELIGEIVELERRNPELAEARPRELKAALSKILPEYGRKSFTGVGTRRARRRYRALSGARFDASGRRSPAKTSIGQGLKPGSHIPVPPPHIVQVDPVNEVAAKLVAELRRSTNLDLTKFDVPRLVQSMLRLVPRKADSNELADKVGPFYDTNGLTNWLGVSRQALEKKISAQKLLACVTTDRVRLYPTWQFTDNGALLPGLPQVLASLGEGTKDAWIMAAWLTTSVEELDGTAVEWLTARRDPAPVIELARHDAAAWAA